MSMSSPTLTLEDVALLLDGVDGPSRETLQRLSRFLREDPRLSTEIEQLESLAQEAGVNIGTPARLQTTLEAHEDFRRLREAEGWEHPAEVLDPEGEAGIYFRELLQIAEQAAARPDAPAEVTAVAERLQQAYAMEREDTARVEGFVEFLLEREPHKAAQLLRLVESQHGLRRTAAPAG